MGSNQSLLYCTKGLRGKKSVSERIFRKTNFLTSRQRAGVDFAIVVLARDMFCLGFCCFGRKGSMYILRA